MLDNNIIRLSKPKIEELLLQFFTINAKIIKGFQSNKVGADSGVVIYYHAITNKNMGLPKRDSTYNSGVEEMEYTEKQILESTFQFNALVPKGSDITASDVLTSTRIVINHLDFIEHIQENNLSVYKPTIIRSGWFESDNGGYEDNPSFDVTFQHEQITTTIINSISEFEANIERV